MSSPCLCLCNGMGHQHPPTIPTPSSCPSPSSQTPPGLPLLRFQPSPSSQHPGRDSPHLPLLTHLLPPTPPAALLNPGKGSFQHPSSPHQGPMALCVPFSWTLLFPRQLPLAPCSSSFDDKSPWDSSAGQSHQKHQADLLARLSGTGSLPTLAPSLWLSPLCRAWGAGASGGEGKAGEGREVPEAGGQGRGSAPAPCPQHFPAVPG